jgi:hypothetical protein
LGTITVVERSVRLKEMIETVVEAITVTTDRMDLMLNADCGWKVVDELLKEIVK